MATISSVTTNPASGALTIGSTVLITVAMLNNGTSQTLTQGTAAPTLSLNNSTKASLVSFSGNTVVFRYVVTSGDAAIADLDAASATAIPANTIRSGGVAQNATNLSLNGFTSLGTTASIACFAEGTRIETPEGARTIETLQIGDEVLTASGAAKPIRWIGKAGFDGMADENSMFHRARPVLFRPGSLGGGLPTAELRVSPEHGMMIDGMLFPAASLVNGVSIVRDAVDAVQYFHIELAEHDPIISEGVISETFIDMDSRAMFDNAAEYDAMYGADTGATEQLAQRCEQGYLLASVRERLAALAGVQPAARSDETAIASHVDGIHENVLHGWVLDTANPDYPVEVEVEVNGDVVGRALANLYRHDLELAGLAGGHCAFRFDLPSDADNLRSIVVRTVNTGAALHNPAAVETV